jgi:hypothetical protein
LTEYHFLKKKVFLLKWQKNGQPFFNGETKNQKNEKEVIFEGF